MNRFKRTMVIFIGATILLSGFPINTFAATDNLNIAGYSEIVPLNNRYYHTVEYTPKVTKSRRLSAKESESEKDAKDIAIKLLDLVDFSKTFKFFDLISKFRSAGLLTTTKYYKNTYRVDRLTKKKYLTEQTIYLKFVFKADNGKTQTSEYSFRMK